MTFSRMYFGEGLESLYALNMDSLLQPWICWAANTETKPSRLSMEIPVAVYYDSKLAVIKNIDVSINYHLCLYAFEINIKFY